MNLSLKSFKLKFIRGFAQAVETTFSNQNGMTFEGFQFLLPMVGEMPRMKTKGRKVQFVLACARMCMNIKV